MNEKPKHCQGCSKKPTIRYRRIVNGKIEEVCACEKCPLVEKHLHGSLCNNRAESPPCPEDEKTICAQCQTSLADIKSGKPLGCGDCYQTFEPMIKSYLQGCNRINRLTEEVGPITLHTGKSPFSSEGKELHLRLTNLSQALNEALKIENYEQAAWLRDRIKILTEQSSDGQQQAS